MMKIGDTVESAAWLTGAEPEGIVDTYKRDVKGAIDRLCNLNGFIHGPVRFIERLPGMERVPDVPDHVQGPAVRLLIGEADLTAKAPEINTRSFIGDLDKKDLMRMRVITRQAHRKNNPSAPILTDTQVDDIIEQIGPEAAMDAVMNAVNTGLVH